MKKTLFAALLLVLLMGFSLWCSHRAELLVRDMSAELEAALTGLEAGSLAETEAALRSADDLWRRARRFTFTLLREDTRRAVEEPLTEAVSCPKESEDYIRALLIQLQILRETETLSWESLF